MWRKVNIFYWKGWAVEGKKCYLCTEIFKETTNESYPTDMAENPQNAKPEENAPHYYSILSPDTVEKIYEQILYKFVVEKKYRDPKYTAQRMAEELGINHRYVSAAVALRHGDNYCQMINEFRLKEAMYMLKDAHYNHLSLDEVRQMAGFSNRQTFCMVFRAQTGLSPREYRHRYAADKDGKKK